MVLLVATTGLMKIGFGLTFLIVMAVAAVITIVNTNRNLSRHNANAQKLRKRANDNIRMEMLINMVVKQSGALLWTYKNGMFHLEKSMRDYLSLKSSETDFKGVLDNNDKETQRKVRDFFNIKTPGEYYLQVYGRMYDKEPHWYAFNMHVSETQEGIESNGITVNIDSLKCKEEKAIESQRMLIRAKERSTFLSIMSHQIRTPLNLIIGFSQLLCEPDMELSAEEVQNYGSEIAYENSRLMKIINDVLTMTLIGNSNIKMTLEPRHVKELMNFSQRDTISSAIKKSGCKIVVEEGLEDSIVIVDFLFICRVIDNIVDNAITASPAGSEINISWHRNEDNTVTIDITDHGCGIAPEYQGKIFERFYRIDKYSQGVGLGLALAKSLIEKMSGTIKVTSTVGTGSTFSITMKSGD